MKSDEEQIRELVATWMAASKEGDVETVLSLMSDDVVFLVPGRPPMGKIEFAEVSMAQTGHAAPKIEGTNDIKEIRVLGDWAFMWTEMTVVVTPPDGSPALERSGHTLSVLKKKNGRWLLARDANMLTTVQKPRT